MELVYLRNCTHNNLKASEFYFSKNHYLAFDNTTLDYSKTDYQNIFSNNLIITAVVGENGSGKSSLLNYIYEFSNKNYYPNDELTANTHSGSDFMIYKKDELYIKGDRNGIFDSSFKLKSNDDSIRCVLIDYNNKVNSTDLCPEYSTLFKIISVLSKKDNILKYFDEKFIFKKFQLNIIREELKYFDEKKYPYSNFFLNLKEKITTLIKNKILPITSLTTFPQINNELMYTTKNIELEIKISFLIKYINYLQERFISQSSSNETFLTQEENFFENLDFENMFEKINEFDEKINNSNIFHSNLNSEIIFFKYLINKLENTSVDIFMQSKYFYDQKNFTEYEASITFNIQENYILIQEIINKLESIKYSDFFECFSFDFLSYDNNVKFTELSSGEQNLINKYMLILYEVLLNDAELILLDEPDVLLHPNWAKKFIKKLVDIITQDSILKEKQLHIIMSTHSPFILSDLPKENVIFLENGKEVDPDITQTFGANIHTLLSNGFFMSDGLMGEFAKSKITEIKDFYDDNKNLKKEDSNFESKKDEFEEHKEYFRNIQKIIGEPFLQTIIKNYLDELEILFNGKKKFLDKEIERLESLKKSLDD